MAILLPAAVFMTLVLLLIRHGDTTRQAILRSTVAATTLLVCITEFLSVFKLLTKMGLIVAWSFVLICVVGLLTKRPKQAKGRKNSAISKGWLQTVSDFTGTDILLATAIALSLTCVGVVAAIAPPNSWDAMEHHLPRVLVWVSNHSVAVYPTPDFAQLLKGPVSEFVALHAYLLCGSDRLVNLIEFVSFAGCGLAASLVAGKLGAGRTGQLVAMLFVATIPEAILESSGAMTTTVASLWAVSACYFIMQASSEIDWLNLITAALATGLALLTDPVSFHALPAVLLACMVARSSGSGAWLLRRLPIVLMLALLVNAGQFIRAYEVTGNILGSPFPEGGPRLNFSNERLTPPAIAASVLRQMSLQLGTPSNKINTQTEAAVRRVIQSMGRDPDDPGASWSGFPFHIDHPTRLETQAGNPVHFFLVLLCMGLAFLLTTESEDERLLWFSGGLIAGFIVFSALVRWQPWGSRFHLPLFVLSAAVVGLIAERVLIQKWMVHVLAAVLVVTASPYLLTNSTRSIVATKGFPTIFEPRAELYFGDQHEALAPAYLAMAQALRARPCGRVAIDAYLPIPEPLIKMSPRAYYIYPLLAQLGIDGEESSVHYIGVNNSTKRFGSSTLEATDCAIVCLTCRLSNGTKSDAGLGETRIFGESELVFPTAAQ